MCEVWKPISGYEGLYEISNYGNVRSLERYKVYRNELRTIHAKILKYNTITSGYKQVALYKSGKRKCLLIHRLVAEAFIDNPHNLPQVNHKDGNKTNNNVANLEWCTAKENMVHSVEHNIRTDLKPVDMFSKAGEYIKTFNCIREAGRVLGIKHHNISMCCRGKYGYKTAGGYIWKFHAEG